MEFNTFSVFEREPLKWNVIGEASFRDRVRRVFEQVANMIKNTLGPYGANTIIERFGEMHITKDGWQILKKIHFEDPTDQNIHQLLLNISAQVVIKVGDGSTSSIVAANQILRELEAHPELKKIRPKDLLDRLAYVASVVGEVIFNMSTKIDQEKDPSLNDIYRLAMISTNGDKEISEIIQKIYQETGNPFIEFVKSKTNRTHYEIVDGYQALISYGDTIYANNEDGTCNIDHPMILMFDHRLDKETHYDKIIKPALALATQQGRRLVVIAPHYDQYLLNAIRTQANIEYKGMGTTTAVYCRVTLTNNMFQEQFNDFAIMTGGEIIRETTLEELHNGDETVDRFIGEVEKISIGPQKTLIRGFFKRNENMYKIAMTDALAKYKRVEETHREMNIVNSELYELKKRISKLKGRMGVIHVGGGSSLEKTSNMDLVEDAIKACESAFNYGYNIGGNLIIPIAIRKIIQEKLVDESYNDILLILEKAFRNVFTKVLENKYGSEYDKEQLNEIIDSAIEKKLCFDLISEQYSEDVINPCFTDIEILKAATSIVALLLSSNQYVSINVQAKEE